MELEGVEKQTEQTEPIEQSEQTNQTEQESLLRIPIKIENLREELNFYRELREVFRLYGKDTDDLDFIMRNLEDSILEYDQTNPALPDEERIKDAIARHPYFKNPCDYPIRLITILKYLKRKGFNLNYTDIDFYVDRLIQKLDGVRKVGRGLYLKRMPGDQE